MKSLILAACVVCNLNPAFAQERGIINTSRSPHVNLRGFDIGDCRWTEGFWADKFRLCEQVMVPHMGALLKGDVGHAYNNFKIVAGLREGEHRGTNWHDGDFYKWMEAVTYVYAVNEDPKILEELDEVIAVIGQAQAEDGYLHTAVMLKGLGRYTNRGHHEMYNSALSGISADGKHYFYTNPLRRTHDHAMDTTDQRTREPYLHCFCCPPNLVRTVAKASGWAYSLSEDGVAVNLYGGSRLNTSLLDGSRIELTQETLYPWEGRIAITVVECKKEPFEIRLRIPGWADDALIRVNGMEVTAEVRPGTYARLHQNWTAGDVITLELPMDVQLLEGHPRIEEVRNQVAIKRGPFVYCVETPDLPEGTDILDVYLPERSSLEARHRPDFLGGMTTIFADVLLRADKRTGMYRTLDRPTWKSTRVQFVPYYAWSNRGVSEMSVWLPIVWE